MSIEFGGGISFAQNMNGATPIKDEHIVHSEFDIEENKDFTNAGSLEVASIAKQNIQTNIGDDNNANADVSVKLELNWGPDMYDDDIVTDNCLPDNGYKFKCEMCNFQTKWESHLKRHSLTHSDTRNYRCAYCDHSSKDKFSLRRHLVTHKAPSEVELHRCPECKFETKWKHIMKDHMLLHVELSDYEVIICPLCKICFKRISDLKKHLLVHQENNTTEIYQCYFCYYRSIRKHCVNRHIMARHRELCITVKSEEDYLDEHIDAPIEGEEEDKEESKNKDIKPIKRLKCAHCDFRTNFRSYLRRHELVHKKTREHKCPQCECSTKDKYSLKRHIMLMHKEASEVTMHFCQYCSYVTKWKHVLKNHQLVHADRMSLTLFRCPVCRYGFKRKSDMVRHRSTHEVEDAKESKVVKNKSRSEKKFKTIKKESKVFPKEEISGC